MAQTVVKTDSKKTTETKPKTQTVSVGGREISVNAPKTNTQTTTSKAKVNTPTVGGRELSTSQVASTLVSKAKSYNTKPKESTVTRTPQANPYKQSYTENDYNTMKNTLMKSAEDPYYDMLWSNVDYKDMWSDEDKKNFEDYNNFMNDLGTKTQIARGDVGRQKKVEDTQKGFTINDIAVLNADGTGNWKDFSQDLELNEKEIEELEKRNKEIDYLLQNMGQTPETEADYKQLKEESNNVKNRLDELKAENTLINDKRAYQNALAESLMFDELRENGTRDEFVEYAKYTGSYMNNFLEDVALNYESSQFRKLAGVQTFIENVQRNFGENEAKRITETITKLYENGDVTESEKNEVLAYAQNILDRNTTEPGESVGLALNDIANQLSEMQNNGETATEKLLVNVVGNILDNSLGQYGPALAFGKAGMVANTALMSFSEYAPTYQEDIEAGFTHEQAQLDALFQTGIEFLSEMIGGERILKFAEGEVLPRSFAELTVEGFKSGLAETAEEGIGWGASPLAHFAATGEIPKLEDWDLNQLKEAAVTAFLAGFIQAEMSADFSLMGTEAPLSLTEQTISDFLTITTDEGKNRVQDLVTELDKMEPEASNRKNIMLSDGTRISERDYIGIVKNVANKQIDNYNQKIQVKGVEIINENRINGLESLAESQNYAIKDCLEVSRQKQINSLYESLNAGQVIQTINEKFAEETQKRLVAEESERLAQVQQQLENEGIKANAVVWDSLNDDAKANATIVSKVADVLNGTPVELMDLRTKSGKVVDGVYLDGKIVVNPNAELGAISTLLHEYTHGIESTRFYSILKDEARMILGNDYQKALNDLIEDYSDIKKLTEEEAEKELVANTVQALLGNKDFISRLVKYHTNMAYKMYTDLKSMTSYSTVAEEFAQNFLRGFTELNPDNIVGGMAVDFSYVKNGEINEAQQKLFDKMRARGKKFSFDQNAIDTAVEQMKVMADLMSENSDLLPNEVIGKVLLNDASYGKSVENSTKCPRTLAYDQLTSLVSDKVGRPLTAVESFLVSQKLYQIAIDPQCLYCYVALDRKSYEEFVGKYVKQRDAAIERYKEAGEPKLVENEYTEDYERLRSEWNEIKNEKGLRSRKNKVKNDLNDIRNDYISKFTEDNPLYKEFLDGRKSTENMIDRYKMWINAYNNGEYLLTEYDVRTSESRDEILAEKGDGWEQLQDMLDYAQSASWAKKALDYRAYFDDIRKLTQKSVDNLNKHYGLRWYSFNDYTPAYILENMQQFTDASLKGLKGLAYTKDVDFAEIFAPTGVNINISMYATRLPDGSIGIDPIMSAELERAIEVRNKYPNVGIVITATNDETINWALNQEWSDVVIPFHIVRTGQDIADYYKWTVYNQEQNDTVISDEKWKEYVNNIENSGSGSPSKMIYPSEHQNDLETYLRLCNERGLKPRFSSFLDNPNYMKLVNETRQSENETGYLEPVFDMDAAMVSFQKFVDKGGYFGGWYKDGVDVKAEANQVANDIIAINEGRMSYEDIDYGEGHEDFELRKRIYDLRNKHALAKVHGRDVSKKVQLSANGESRSNIEDIVKNSDVLDTNIVDQALEEEAKEPKKEEKVAKILPNQRKEDNLKEIAKNAKTRAGHYIVDRYTAIDELAERTDNKKLVPLVDAVQRAPGRANAAIYSGIYDREGKNKIGKSLTEIMGKIPQQYRASFDDYMYHQRNIDEMTMVERVAKPELEKIAKQLKALESNNTLDEETKKKQKKELEKKQREYEKYKDRPVFGKSVTADVSRQRIAEIEQTHPEFKAIADDMWELNRNLLKMRMDAGIISKETYDKFVKERPHYTRIIRNVENASTGASNTNPNDIKKFKGSTKDLLSVEDAMTQHIFSTYRVAANNELNAEVMNALGLAEDVEADDIESLVEDEYNPVSEDKGDKTIYAYKDGKKYAVPVDNEIHNALSPVKDYDNPLKKLGDVTIAKASALRRALLTNANPIFSLITNPLKDIQDVARNTKYLKKYPRNLARAIYDIAHNGEYSKQYDNLGIRTSQYLGKDIVEAYEEINSEDKSFIKKVFELGENIEKIPRLAEFISAIEAGESVEQAALDAAEVTTNFKRGGTIVKTMDKYGFTFLNASVQGFDKQIRNAKGDFKKIRENGWKGALSVMAQLTLASGLPLRLIQDWFWRDDDEYKELSDYIKNNYYIVAKRNGRFVRVPKGRVAAFYQTVLYGGYKTITKQMDAWNMLLDDYQSFMNNIAPNNFMDNNILSPLVQAASNKTWYGSDLVPSRLQDDPDYLQYDETTDLLSIKMGELSKKVADALGNDKLQISPYKMHYLLDQYSGFIGDVALPAMALETEVGIDNPVLKGAATSILDKFTSDPILKNQNVTSFYSLKEVLDKRAKDPNATEEEKLSSKYLGTVSSAMGKLYGEKRDIQMDKTLSNKEKLAKVRQKQTQINDLAREALANYDQINLVGNYANVGGVQYYMSEDGWRKPSKSQLETLSKAGLSDEDMDGYFTTMGEISSTREKIKADTPKGEKASYTKDTVDLITNSNMSAKGKNTLFDSYYSGKATDHINKMDLTDEEKYNLKVANKLAEGIKDKNGKTISNSKAEATAEAYKELGLLDDVLKYIKDNDIAPSELGLSKTVYNKLMGKSSYQGAYNSSMSSKSSKKKKSSTKAKNVSSSLKGGGSATKIRTNRATPIKGNTNFKKAYQNVFSQSRQGSKNVSSGSSGGGVCPNCGARVSANASRCPNCGAKL